MKPFLMEEHKKMNIKTERLVIRTFEPEDWQDVYAYTSNPSVMKYIPEGSLPKKMPGNSLLKTAVNMPGSFPFY